jgi:hypothetical protein
MAESIFAPHTESQAVPQFDPELRHTTNEPKGVLQKNLKTFVYLGAALLVIVAAIMSSTGKKTPAQQAAQKGQPPQPTLQDNTDNNVQDLKNQLQAQRQKEQQQAALAAATGGDPALASATPAQRAAAAAYGPTGAARLAWPVSPARNRRPATVNKAPDNYSSVQYRSRHSRLPRRNEHGPTTRVSLPTLRTPVLPSSRNHKDQAR